ncbi:MAG: metal-sensitive transcriptional regulator [Firmicutes bacterium]|nr:metal-sensitive transcriptional regulator [Bacillota bacterium]
MEPERAERTDILQRLRTIRGHVAGIERMVEGGRDWEQVLSQLSAVRASVDKVQREVIAAHAAERGALVSAGESDAGDELAQVVNTILRFL